MITKYLGVAFATILVSTVAVAFSTNKDAVDACNKTTHGDGGHPKVADCIVTSSSHEKTKQYADIRDYLRRNPNKNPFLRIGD